MNLRLIFALLGTTALIACAGDKEATDDTAVDDSGVEGDADSDTDADTDSDSDADPLYSAWSGVEAYSFGFSLNPGEGTTCSVIWDVTGTPSTTDCPDCLFAFDVSLVYDEANSNVTEDCVSRAKDTAYAYGYIEDYYGYGPAVMYYGAYGWSAFFFSAELDSSDDTLKYAGGVIDYYYSTVYTGYVPYYLTSYYTGEAQLTK
jgi:hypothetical protein